MGMIGWTSVRGGVGAASAAALLALPAVASGQGAPATVGVASPNCGPVQYGGPGAPSGVIVSDLPMVGDSAQRSSQMVTADLLALEQAGWRAGSVPIGFQACNDASPKTGAWDADMCRANAQAYATTPTVLGVVGTYNSGCAAAMIPILNQASTPMVSPGNTLICLTEPARGCGDGMPGSLYPTGVRSYVRVIPNDAYQGAGLASFASRLHVRRPFLLYAAHDVTSTGQARTYRGAARALGQRLAGMRTWDPQASNYRRLMRKVKRAQPDAIVLAGLIDQNGARLIRDKVKVVGGNRHVPLLAFDGFAQQETIRAAGRASRGMYASVPGVDPSQLPGRGAAFTRALAAKVAPAPVELFAPYAGQATAVLLSALERAGGSRSAAASALVGTQVTDGILGSFGFTARGDSTLGQVTVYRAAATMRPARLVTPRARSVRAARLG